MAKTNTEVNNQAAIASNTGSAIDNQISQLQTQVLSVSYTHLINEEHLIYASRSISLDSLFLRPAMSLLKLDRKSVV